MISLPFSLSRAIEEELEYVPSKDLQQACVTLTENYVQGRGIENSAHRHAYIAARLPATYGVAYHILERLPLHLRSSLHTLLDLGAGVGSLSWAAHLLLPNLSHASLWERDKALIETGKRLIKNTLAPLSLKWNHCDITQFSSFPRHDSLVVSYVLNELSPYQQDLVLTRAYQASCKLLILIEPGTPQGFKTILKCRDILLKQGARIIAPCPHHAPCPLLSSGLERPDWCHFKVRIPRLRIHKQAKNAKLSYEDEKYTYLVVSPYPAEHLKERIIRPPLKKPGHVILDLCIQKGQLRRETVTKKDGMLYKYARQSEWGDEWTEGS